MRSKGRIEGCEVRSRHFVDMIAKKYWPFYTVSQHCLGHASQHGNRRLLLTEWADVEGLKPSFGHPKSDSRPSRKSHVEGIESKTSTLERCTKKVNEAGVFPKTDRLAT